VPQAAVEQDDITRSGALSISDETTKTHVKRILAKLGLRDRAQAVMTAYESGLVTPGG
jgi:DNA-binding NarL/FixJ family response regulator